MGLAASEAERAAARLEPARPGGETGRDVSPRRWLTLLLAAPALTGCATLGVPRGATAQGRDIHGLWTPFFWIAVAVAAIVYGLILWSVVRYRRREPGIPPQFRLNIPIEALYTILPIVTVAVLFVLAFRTESQVEQLTTDPAVTVHVRAFDWSWRFDYEGQGVSVFGTPDSPPELVVPAGQTVRIRLESDDVIHSFFVPDFLFKRDAIPGVLNEFDLLVEEPGVHSGQCAEFCGLDHARMRFTIRAVSPGEFSAWLATHREVATAPTASPTP
jgi:cytochrome c oxidase subunit 2